MMHLARLIFALVVMCGLCGSSHYYLWARLVRDAQLPAPYGAGLTALLTALALGIPSALVLLRGRSGPWVQGLTAGLQCWMGLFFILLTLLLLGDLARLGLWLVRPLVSELAAPDAERRQLLVRLVAGGTLSLGLLLAGIAMRTALAGPQLLQVHVNLPKLPAALAGLRIVQISDLHVASLLGAPYVRRVVDQANALKPDLIAVTGDLVDGSVAQLRTGVAPLADLRARYGTFFITGNHEYYSGVEAWLTEVRRLGMHVLRNERVRIGSADVGLDLAGIDDYTSAGLAEGHGPDLAKAVAGRDPNQALILLAHQPRHIHLARTHGVDLMLSGHTHGGQIWPFGYIVRLVQPFLAGLGRLGDTQIYVSRGTGYWGPPMRLGAPPELTLLILSPERPPPDANAGS